jgi:hypothetical protein
MKTRRRFTSSPTRRSGYYDQKAGAARGRRRPDLLPGRGQPEGKEPGSQGGLCAGVHLRAAGLLEEGAEASGDLPQLLRVLWRQALVGEQRSAVKGDVEEISGVGRRS